MGGINKKYYLSRRSQSGISSYEVGNRSRLCGGTDTSVQRNAQPSFATRICMVNLMIGNVPGAETSLNNYSQDNG